MAVLNTLARNELKKSDFAIPESRMYPIDTEVRARLSLARAVKFGSEEEKSRVRAAVKKRFPNIMVSD